MEVDTLDFFQTVSPLLNAKLMSEAPAEWDYVLANADYVPVACTRSMVLYQSAYITERVDSFADLSMILFHDDKPVGVWPLNMRFFEGVWVCGSNEGQVCPPLFIEKISGKARKALITGCLSVLDTVCRMNGQKVWKGIESIGANGLDQWHRKIMERGGALQQVSHELFVDLYMRLEEIRSNIGKSYKSLLSMGDKLWQMAVLDKVSPEVFSEFRQLHYHVAGRSTRSAETWSMQEQAIHDGEAFLVVLRDSNGVMVGGGLFHISKSEGLYAVGAYNRDLFDKPLGHVVQMKAVEYMKKRGLRWYKIGERFYPGDSGSPTEKELSISHFKEGFATHMFLRLHFELS